MYPVLKPGRPPDVSARHEHKSTVIDPNLHGALQPHTHNPTKGNDMKFKPLDRVRHKDGREGQVERVTVDKVTVQFAHHWRSSVIHEKNLTLIEKEQDRD